MSTSYNRCLWFFSADDALRAAVASALPIQTIARFSDLEAVPAIDALRAPLLLDVRNEDEDDALQTVAYAVAKHFDVWTLVSDATAPTQMQWLERTCVGRVRKRDALDDFFAYIENRSPARFEYLAEANKNLIAVMLDGTCFVQPLTSWNVTDVERIDIDEDGKTAHLYDREKPLGGPFSLSAETFLSEALRARSDVSGSATTDLSQVDATALGARLRALRTAAGLTQAAVADRTGIHRPNVARVEAGRHMPSLETLARYAQAIGTSIPELLRDLEIRS